MAKNWTLAENRLIIADYFEMLGKEIRGEPYVKADHWRRLIPKLNGRSKGSIESKHMNISAVLIAMNLPFIIGYKPLGNFQILLAKMVDEYMAGEAEFEFQFERFTQKEVSAPKKEEVDFENLLVATPKPLPAPKKQNSSTQRIRRKPNYLRIEQDNRKLGRSGEELIFEYEKWWLNRQGKQTYADQVEWLSDVEGDGAGYDILSKYENGKDKLIEVKTTKLSEFTPFFFTRNEMEVSQQNRDKYHLYRVFKFATKPAFFVKRGSFDDICSSYKPTQFQGRI